MIRIREGHELNSEAKFITDTALPMVHKVRFLAGCLAQTFHEFSCSWSFVLVGEYVNSQTVSTHSIYLQNFKATTWGTCRGASEGGLLQFAQDPFYTLLNFGHFDRGRFSRLRSVQNGSCAS